MSNKTRTKIFTQIHSHTPLNKIKVLNINQNPKIQAVVQASFQGVNINTLLDSGSDENCIDLETYKLHISHLKNVTEIEEDKNIQLFSASGDKLPWSRVIETTISLGETSWTERPISTLFDWTSNLVKSRN
jgi:hypothetical protein